MSTANAFTPVWSGSLEAVEIRSFGRLAQPPVEQLAALLGGGVTATAWLEQVHSAAVVTARPGGCGRADAFVTQRRALALCVVTADCVPVVVAARSALAVVHAGWRGIVSGVVPAALEAVPGARAAWVGPAIGPCCYEVGDEVANRVAEAAGSGEVVRRTAARPHLDLQEAVARQLGGTGVREVHTVRRCTRCSADLCSYRRDGAGAGRNVTAAWLRP